MSHKAWMVSAVLLGPLACGELDAPEGEDISPAPISTVDAGASAGADRTLQIDASRMDAWTYFDLETGQVASEPAALPGWDLAMQRMSIKLNGGVSGTAGVQASVVTGTPYASLSAAPAAGWDTDRADGPDTDLMADFLLSVGETSWYDYDGTSHKLSPRPHVYAVKSGEGTYYKLAVLNYYNAAGSAGYLTVQWAKIAAPSGATSGRDAGSTDATTSASKPAADGGI